MKIINLHKSFLVRRWILFLATVIFLGMRLFWPIKGDPVEFWLSALLQAGIAFFLLFFTKKNEIIRQKTLLPAHFYLLFAGTNPLFFNNPRATIAATLVMLCIYLLFNNYQNKRSQRNMLSMTLILTLGAFYCPFLWLLFPLFWYGMIRFKAFTLKTFMASITGLAAVALFLASWSIYQSDWTILEQTLAQAQAVCTFQYRPPTLGEWPVIVLLLFLFLLSGYKLYMAGISEKIQSMNMLRLLYSFAFVFIFLYFFQNEWRSEWLLTLQIPLSVLAAHLFTIAKRRAEMRLFLLILLLFLSFYIYNWLSLP
jgi:hypothetical protein